MTDNTDRLVLTIEESKALTLKKSIHKEIFKAIADMHTEGLILEVQNLKRLHENYVEVSERLETLSAQAKKARKWELSQKAQEAHTAYNKETKRLTDLERALSHQCRRTRLAMAGIEHKKLLVELAKKKSHLSVRDYVKVDVEIGRDDLVPAFGAYLSPTVQEGAAIIKLNTLSMMAASATTDSTFLEYLVEAIMHEVGHALEERLGLEFSEERMEDYVGSYVSLYGEQQMETPVEDIIKEVLDEQ